jgi:transcriptional regulator ATRX
LLFRPIKAGEDKDASRTEISQMKRRTHVLYAKLNNIVNRKDLTILAAELPSKREFIISCKITPFQKFLYKMCLAMLSTKLQKKDGGKNVLFLAYQNLMRIWNHPGCVMYKVLSDKMNTTKKSSSSRNVNLESVQRELSYAHNYFLTEGGKVGTILDLKAQQVEQILNKNDLVEICDDDDFVIGSSSDDEDDEVGQNLETSTADDEGDDNDEGEDLLVSKASASPPSLSTTPSSVVQDDRITPVYGNDDGSIQLNISQLGRDVKNPPVLALDKFVELGNKMLAFLTILVLSVKLNDKILLFSQSLVTLDMIQLVLGSNNWGNLVAVGNGHGGNDDDDADDDDSDIEEINFGSCSSSSNTVNRFTRWKLGKQYQRIDGSVSDRQPLIDDFNNSTAFKLFLISTRAGNMGINLYTANRVIIFDSSWNPANDLQAVYRAYRFGQKKNVFVYRLLAAGTMEEKIYKKQVQKLALANRVVDKQMPDNQFTVAEKAELLAFDDKIDSEDVEHRASLIANAQSVLSKGTRDEVLIKLLETHNHIISSLEDQGELLKDNELSHLTEAEREQAEEDYENELAGRRTTLHAATALDIRSVQQAQLAYLESVLPGRAIGRTGLNMGLGELPVAPYGSHFAGYDSSSRPVYIDAAGKQLIPIKVDHKRYIPAVGQAGLFPLNVPRPTNAYSAFGHLPPPQHMANVTSADAQPPFTRPALATATRQVPATNAVQSSRVAPQARTSDFFDFFDQRQPGGLGQDAEQVFPVGLGQEQFNDEFNADMMPAASFLSSVPYFLNNGN